MPSRDSTGKRFSGGRQRSCAAEARAGRGPRPDARLKLQPPPRGEGLDALIAWTARAQVDAAGLAAADLAPQRVRGIQHCTRAIGSMKVAAGDSELAVQVLAKFHKRRVVFDRPKPPKEDAALPLWVVWMLADLLFLAATSADPIDDTIVGHRAAALKAMKEVVPQAAIDAVLAPFQAEDAEDDGT